MAISFDRIPIDIRTPGQYIEFDASQALGGLPAIRHKILVIGQRLPTGEVDALAPTLVTSAEQAEAAFGRGSMLSAMIQALRQVNAWTETWAIALDDDGAGVPAAGSLTFGGAIGGAGTVNLYIAGRRVRFAVAADDTLSDVATNAAAAINAATELPVTAAVNGTTPEQVDVTARHAGEASNAIDLRVNYYQGETLPKDLTVTVAAMTGGSGNPDLAGVVAAVSDTQYHTWIVPYTDGANLTVLADEMDRRWGPLVQMDAHAYLAAAGTLAELQTLGDGRNSEHLTIIGADGSPTPPWQWAAALGGTIAYYGNNDPARPFQTLPLRGVLAPKEADRFDQAEREILLHDGISTFVVGDAGNRYMALAGSFGAGAAVRQVANLERRFTRLGIQANISAGKTEALTRRTRPCKRASPGTSPSPARRNSSRTTRPRGWPAGSCAASRRRPLPPRRSQPLVGCRLYGNSGFLL